MYLVFLLSKHNLWSAMTLSRKTSQTFLVSGCNFQLKISNRFKNVNILGQLQLTYRKHVCINPSEVLPVYQEVYSFGAPETQSWLSFDDSLNICCVMDHKLFWENVFTKYEVEYYLRSNTVVYFILFFFSLFCTCSRDVEVKQVEYFRKIIFRCPFFDFWSFIPLFLLYSVVVQFTINFFVKSGLKA